jgi:hypothetical protein
MDVRFNKRLKFEDSKGDKEKIAEKLDFLDMLNPDQHLSLKQVADFYEVDCNEVKKILKECTNEFKDDNVISTTTDTYEEFIEKFGNDFSYCEPTGKQWEIKDEKTTIQLPQMSILLLPTRAVRRVGFFLSGDIADAVKEELIEYLMGTPSEAETFIKSVTEKCSEIMECFEEFAKATIEDDKYGIYSNMKDLIDLNNKFKPLTQAKSQEILDFIVTAYDIPEKVIQDYELPF